MIDLPAGTGALQVMARSAVFRFKKIDDPIGVARKLNAAAVLVGKFVPGKNSSEVSAELAATIESLNKYFIFMTRCTTTPTIH